MIYVKIEISTPHLDSRIVDVGAVFAGPGHARRLVAVGGDGHELLVRLPGEEVLAVLGTVGPLPLPMLLGRS